MVLWFHEERYNLLSIISELLQFIGSNHVPRLAILWRYMPSVSSSSHGKFYLLPCLYDQLTRNKCCHVIPIFQVYYFSTNCITSIYTHDARTKGSLYVFRYHCDISTAACGYHSVGNNACESTSIVIGICDAKNNTITQSKIYLFSVIFIFLEYLPGELLILRPEPKLSHALLLVMFRCRYPVHVQDRCVYIHTILNAKSILET